MNTPKFIKMDEEANFRVGIKRKLRKAGILFDNDLSTSELIELETGINIRYVEDPTGIFTLQEVI